MRPRQCLGYLDRSTPLAFEGMSGGDWVQRSDGFSHRLAALLGGEPALE